MKHFARHLDYLHCNPVKHGMAARAADWPYYSLPRFVELGIYPMDWGYSGGVPEIAGDRGG